jgi:hypothetical protein
MPLVLPGVDEPTFNKLSQRFHRTLAKRHPDVPALLSLGQCREALVEAMGHRSLHDARQAWQKPATVPVCAAWQMPLFETYDRLLQSPVQLHDDARGCDYQGHEFGASYPDSLCVKGVLWDADSVEDGFLTSGGETPCPWCNHRAYVEGGLEAVEEQGFDAHEKGKPRTANPHPKASRFHHLEDAFQAAWDRGWIQAQAEEAVAARPTASA